MIEPKTLLTWTHELVAFANGHTEPHPLFTAVEAEPEESYRQYRLPEEPRTPKQLEALRTTASKCLAALAKTKRSKVVDAKLARLAEDWLDDPLVRSTSANFSLTPMDGLLSLAEDGRLQVTPRFRSRDAQYAVTFAELIQPKPHRRPLVKRCDHFPACDKFCVREPKKGRPRLLCDEHSGKRDHRGRTKTFKEKPMKRSKK